MTGRYVSEDRALTRVRVLQQAGIWPAVKRHADGSADLTFDPQAPIEQEEP